MNNSSRRQFLGLAGGVAGVAALAAIGTKPTYASSKPQANAAKMRTEEIQTEVLVIGGGIAALFAAVKAYDAGALVTIASKGRLGSSGQTPFAKGIFSYDKENEKLSIDEFVAKVSRSALETNNKFYTKQLAQHSKERVDELKQWGFFDSPLYNKCFTNQIEQRNIPLHERVMITNLIKEDGKIAGAAGFSLDEEKIIIYKAKSVILCTGAGGFKPNGFPICDLTHDGTIMAYKIGAKVTGKEWNDGHPGQSENAAACYDGWHGMFEQKPNIVNIGVRHDLGVDLNYMSYQNGGGVKMGPPGSAQTVSGGPYIPKEFLHKDDQGPGNGEDEKGGRPPKREDGKRPPKGKEGGGPPGMNGSPVGGSSAGLSIHKSEGLVPINDKCESTIKGLYAAGDALGSHMAGAIYTQIGSSLAGSSVQGAIAGVEAAKYIKDIEIPKISNATLSSIKKEILAPLRRESGYSPAWVTKTLQSIMIPNFVLYIKKESMLQGALSYVKELRDHHVPMMKASSMHELRLVHETSNMVLSAQMKLEASLMRKESRCSHYRLDYPNMDQKNWRAWINIYQDNNGEMAFEKQSFGTWPKA